MQLWAQDTEQKTVIAMKVALSIKTFITYSLDIKAYTFEYSYIAYIRMFQLNHNISIDFNSM
jgi:hypothetical protein